MRFRPVAVADDLRNESRRGRSVGRSVDRTTARPRVALRPPPSALRSRLFPFSFRFRREQCIMAIVNILENGGGFSEME